MKIRATNIYIAALLLLSIGLVNATNSDLADHGEIISVVAAFNEALTAKDLDGTLATLADGAVQFTLRTAHPEMVANDGISSDLKTHWSTIGPVLFSTMESYARKATILDVRVNGDVASVWTRINTVSIALGSGQSRQSEFTELYVIVDVGDGWQIGAIADNRQTDTMKISLAD